MRSSERGPDCSTRERPPGRGAGTRREAGKGAEPSRPPRGCDCGLCLLAGRLPNQKPATWQATARQMKVQVLTAQLDPVCPKKENK